MGRQPLYGPVLDQANKVSLVDPTPARVAHLNTAADYAHALFTGWGGAGIWIPIHMDNNEVPDDPQIPVRIAPGVDRYILRALVSQRDKADPKTCTVTVTSANGGGTTELTFIEAGAGDDIDGAFQIITNGEVGAGGPEPLAVRSGYQWDWQTDQWTITFDVGVGTLWGIAACPIHVER